jgi:hypothetical protein
MDKMISYFNDNDGHFFVDTTTKKQFVPYWIIRYGLLTIKLIPIEDEDKLDESYFGEEVDSNAEWGRFKFVEQDTFELLKLMVIDYNEVEGMIRAPIVGEVNVDL